MAEVTCRVVSASNNYQGKQGFSYGEAISAQSVGAQGICMNLVTVPPGGKAHAHLHENHESAIYVLEGEGAMWFGPKLDDHLEFQAGDFVYIPAGMPHLAYNPSPSVTLKAVLARTDPNEQESVVLLPQLEKAPPAG